MPRTIVALCIVGLWVAGGWTVPTPANDEPTAQAVERETEDDGFEPPPGLHEGWYARIETPKGRIVARLLPEQSPQAVAHFAALAMNRLPWPDPVTGEEQTGHYYDGSPIYKAFAGRYLEAGDWSATGKGAPGLFINREGEGPVNFHGSYRLGMTQQGIHTSGVTFFITVATNTTWSGRFPCFGSVVHGRQVVYEITQVKTLKSGRPIDPLSIDEIRIFAIGDPEPLPALEPYDPETRGKPSLREGYRRHD